MFANNFCDTTTKSSKTFRRNAREARKRKVSEFLSLFARSQKVGIPRGGSGRLLINCSVAGKFNCQEARKLKCIRRETRSRRIFAIDNLH